MGRGGKGENKGNERRVKGEGSEKEWRGGVCPINRKIVPALLLFQFLPFVYFCQQQSSDWLSRHPPSGTLGTVGGGGWGRCLA